jgi:hypothetical protein
MESSFKNQYIKTHSTINWKKRRMKNWSLA